jgi:heme exporter protein CcmD
MEDAGFIIASYVLTFAVVGGLAAWVIRSGRRLAKRTPDAEKYWT